MRTTLGWLELTNNDPGRSVPGYQVLSATMAKLLMRSLERDPWVRGRFLPLDPDTAAAIRLLGDAAVRVLEGVSLS